MSNFHTVMLYPNSFGQRPSKETLEKNMGAIKKGVLKNKQPMTIVSLAEHLTTGYCFVPNELSAAKDPNQYASNAHFVSTSLMVVDIDRSKELNRYLSYGEIIDRCEQNNLDPALVYTTLSCTEKTPKFRVVFALDQLITSQDMYRDTLSRLIYLFDGDTNPSDPSRIFFPGLMIMKLTGSALVNLDQIRRLPLPKTKTGDALVSSHRKHKDLINSSGRVKQVTPEIKAIKRLDAADLRRRIGSEVFNLQTRWNNYMRSALASCGTLDCTKDIKVLCTPSSLPPSTPVTPIDPRDYYTLTSMIPLDLLLGLPFGQKVNCIYPHHKDENPSARIEQAVEGSYLYHCYGCRTDSGHDAMDDIFKLIETIANCSHVQAKKFIRDVFGLHYETKWTMEKREDITAHLNFIESEEFPKHFPKLYKELKKANALGTYSFLLRTGLRYIFDERNAAKNGDPIFYQSIREIGRKMKDFGHRGTRPATIHRKIMFLNKLGLIHLLDNNNIPAFFLNYIESMRIEQQKKYRTNFFALPLFTMSLFDNADCVFAQEYENKGIRRRTYNVETEINSNGKEPAKELFVQTSSHRLIDKIDMNEKFYEQYRLQAAKDIYSKGYLIENKFYCSMRGYTRADKERLHLIFLPRLIREMKLVRKTFTKKIGDTVGLKPKKNLAHYGATKILLPKGCEALEDQ